MTVFRQIVPNSIVRPSNERYEHMLVWLSVDGGVRSWFFSHTDGAEENDHDGFEIETLVDIRQVPSDDRLMVECTTRFMDSETFDYVKSIIKSNRVYKVAKDGTKTPIAVKAKTTVRPNKIKNFELSIQFMYKENDVLNV